MSQPLLVQFRFLPRNSLIAVVRLYQKTLSPDHGAMKGMYPYGFCRHSPTCSMYAIEQLRTRGAIIGSAKAFWRIVNCNPWTKPTDKRLEEAVKVSLEKLD